MSANELHDIARLTMYNFAPPGDPLLSTVTGGAGLLSGGTNAPFAQAATDAWFSNTVNDHTAATVEGMPVSWNPIETVKSLLPDGGTLKRGALYAGVLLLGAVLLVLALYLLARD